MRRAVSSPKEPQFEGLFSSRWERLEHVYIFILERETGIKRRGLMK